MTSRINKYISYAILTCGAAAAAALNYANLHHDSLTRRRLDGSNENSLATPKIIQTYSLWEPQLISKTLLEWAGRYPDFVRVTTAQDAFGLPRAGSSNDCPYDLGGDGCLNFIVTMQDFVKHPENSESSNRLPEVLWSGEVHGNEQVGPTAVLEAAQVMLDAAECESLPRTSMKESIRDWKDELEAARKCRQNWSDRGYLDYDLKWLARLLSTRRIVFVPTANALGYFRKVREEGNIDPNRDFPYDLRDPTLCMQTIAGRTLNEVFRSHMFQLSLTFHGGMEVIGYEWGAPSWTKPNMSPDDAAQSEIAAAYSRYGGGFAQSKPYEYGNMNDLVYPVRGGMEDFAYAGSWDTDRMLQCEPTTFGGYPKEKTVYGPSTLRVFNMLVESSNDKIPSQSTLGTSENLLRRSASDGTKGNGYVSRNIRLSLLAAEFVEPYVAFTSVNELELSDDVVPLMRPEGRSCQITSAVKVPFNSRKVVLNWHVGGALTIDETRLWYAKWDDVPLELLDCLSQPSFDDLQRYFREGKLLTDARGTTRFSKDGSAGQPFAGSIDISEGFGPNDKLVVLAIARVDQNWGSQIEQANPSLPPQSHIVNARTNSSWYHESAGKIIQGRLDWFSGPLTVMLGEFEDLQADQTVDTIEISNRFGANGGTAERQSQNYLVWTLFSVVVIGAVLLSARALRHKMRQSRRDRIRETIDVPSTMPSMKQNYSPVNGNGQYYDAAGGITGELELGEYA
ncbi:hypothetical protein MPSEU_000223500 [Mayamaea pseudoterrestris]|nr:hypothetical protein MPSEU_000223500 [Mayamaea pseudoterrestris]